MVADIIADDHLVDGTIPCGQFDEQVLIEQVKVLLKLVGRKGTVRIVRGVQINVWDEQGDTIIGLYVFSRTFVAMSACAYLVVKGTVDPNDDSVRVGQYIWSRDDLLVLFRAIDGSQVLGHYSAMANVRKR